MINQDQLNYELYRRNAKELDVIYYRTVTSSADSWQKITKYLEQFTEGFVTSDVTLEQFEQDYQFGKFILVKDWVRFYAEKGLRLQVKVLYKYLQEVC